MLPINIKNKLESKNMIEKLGINRLQETLFKGNEVSKVKEFLNNNEYKYYVIRDKINSSGNFLYKLTKTEVLKYVNDYELFSIAESSANFEEHRILGGDIWITKDWEVIASVDDDCSKSFRDCENNSKYNLRFSLLEGYEPNIIGLKSAINYILKHELIDVVVEISVYDKPFGVNKENILIWEIRNY